MNVQETSLIPISQSTINGETKQTVNAGELHEFLEVKTRFNGWITSRIKDFGFEEGRDFVVNLITENLVIKKHGGNRRSKDYHITLDMAKELSMVERNAKGKQAYLISPNSLNKTAIKPACATSIAATHLMMSDLAASRSALLADLAISISALVASPSTLDSCDVLRASDSPFACSSEKPDDFNASKAFNVSNSTVAIGQPSVPLHYQKKRQKSIEKNTLTSPEGLWFNSLSCTSGLPADLNSGFEVFKGIITPDRPLSVRVVAAPKAGITVGIFNSDNIQTSEVSL